MEADLRIMTLFSEEMEAKAGLNASRTSPTLSSITLGNESLNKSTKLTLLVIALRTGVSIRYAGEDFEPTASLAVFRCQ